MDQKIKMIALENIYPHPDNPRKDLGDLTELADSIEKNGIMQNLTVMPGHYLTDADQEALQEKYAETKDQKYLRKMAEGWSDEGFTLLIGHRRAAAAKMARMTTVPCTVVKIPDKKEQISIMLEENMQRTDLTIREQAQGFQMMLDLGDTVETVAKKTGFSTQTIKHRIEIAKLDPEAIAAAEEEGFYQISISDYMKLEKLPTIEMRNEVLWGVRDGRQLDFKVKDKLQGIRDGQIAKKITEKLVDRGVKEAGKKVNRWDGNWTVGQEIEYDGAGNVKKIDKPEECVWMTGYRRVIVLRKKKDSRKKELSEFDKKTNYDNRRRKKCREIQKDMDARRRSFILRIANHDVMPAPVNHERQIIDTLLSIALDGDAWMSKMELTTYYTGKDRWSMNDEDKKTADTAFARIPILVKLLMAVDKHFAIRTGTDEECLINYKGEVKEDRRHQLRNLYGILDSEYGYVLADDEKGMLQKKHDVFMTYEDAKAAGKT